MYQPLLSQSVTDSISWAEIEAKPSAPAGAVIWEVNTDNPMFMSLYQFIQLLLLLLLDLIGARTRGGYFIFWFNYP